MRKTLLILVAILLIGLVAAFYPRWVEKPVKDGEGPLAVYISAKYTAPEYHSPLEYWKRHHMDMLNRGDLAQSDCLYCHVAEQSCNNCHSYVGAKAVVK
jgi:hypothetical protein